MSPCPRPLDPLDAEAVACGAEPVFAADAASHAAKCPSCGEAVRGAELLAAEIDRFSGVPEGPADLADRVIRIRPFSGRERRTYALWRVPLLLCGALGLGGILLLASPDLTAGGQAGLGTALASPVLALARSLTRWTGEILSQSPLGLEALAQALQADRALGLTALLLLGPAGFAMTRVLSRAKTRR